MRKSYGSDITREQFELIRPILEGARKKTCPRQADLYEIFCAILYLTKSGCQWRMIPGDFPAWEQVRYYYDIWKKQVNGNPSILERCLKLLVEMHRERDGRKKNEFLHN